MVLRVLKSVFWAGLFFTALSGGALTATYYSTLDELPDVNELKHVSFETPMKIYTTDGKLIGEFGEHKRIPVKLNEIPEKMQQAFLAIEDSRFYEHTGIDPIGILRAVLVAITSGGASQGASTITQQVARNFFLSRDKTIERKIKEIFIAWRIEQVLTKEEILELYLNKIALGHRSYGVVAAAQTYYGKKLNELTLAEMATIAGLPKAPSTLNPITNPQRAKDRRHLVLQRMLGLGYISQSEFDEADIAPSKAYFHSAPIEAYAPYVAEEARQFTLKRFGEEAYTKGFKVYTTVKADYQTYAQEALVKNLTIYDVRHGYRGPLLNIYDSTRGTKGTAREPVKKNGLNANVNNGLIMNARKALIEQNTANKTKQTYLEVVNAVNNMSVLPADLKIPTYEEIITLLQRENKYYSITPGLILSIDDQNKTAQVLMPDGTTPTLTWEGMSWARAFKNDRTQGELPVYPSEFLLTGDIIFTYEQTIIPEKKNKKSKDPEPQPYKLLTLTQLPDVEGALLAINPKNGAIEAMAGGFDFEKSKFNRTTQLLRQTGSNFKPFIYSSALAYGISVNSVIPDDPIKTWDEGSRTWWQPRNSPNRFEGPMTIREGLAKSKNSISIRLIRQVGVQNAVEHLSKFDINVPKFQQSESMALGTMELTPLQVATAYSTFANGGYKLTPFIISRIELETGEVLYEAKPKIAGYNLPDEVVNAIPLKYTDPKKNALIAQQKEEEKKRLKEDKQGVAEQKQAKIDNALNLENVENQEYDLIAPQILTHSHAYLLSSLMHSVIYGGEGLNGRYWGTGSRAATITGRDDLYGKTGTTNNVHDAWFSGFNANLVVTTWVGFDNERDLGYSRTRGSESGSATALPIFADFFKKAQEGVPSSPIPKPSGLGYSTNRGITEPTLPGMHIIDEGASSQKTQENTGIDSSDVKNGDIF